MRVDINEAIQHCLDVAEQCDLYKIEMEYKCGEEHRQLARWLMELKQWRRVYGVCPSYEMCIPECKEGYDAQISECKRLLKLAMEDFSLLDREHDKNKSCMMRTMDCAECPLNNGKDEPCHEWRYANEAKKLLGEEF